MHTAREVEQFGYCPHNWLLARRNVEGTPARAQDVGLMRAHRRVQVLVQERSFALRWMFRVLLGAISATALTLELVYLRTTGLHWVFLATALVMTGAAAGLLVLAGIAERRAAAHAQELGIIAGQVVSAPGTHREVLEDPSWGLRGVPDYILQSRRGQVPVQLRSGRTPVHPYPSHQLQITAYMRLLEAQGNGRHRPPYGLIQYPDGIFRVDYTDDLQARLRHTLRRMDQAVADGRADRDHEDAARCIGCARREGCTQRLA